MSSETGTSRLSFLGIAAFATLLIISLLGNVLLAVALWDTFGKLQAARIFPLGYAPHAQHLAPSSRLPHSIAFWGDSRAYHWDTQALSDRWAIFNFAHGGQTSSQLLLQMDSTLTTHTDVAVVQIGINDLHPLGVLHAQQHEVISRLRENLGAVRDRLLTRADLVIMTTIFPPGPVPLARRLAWDPRTREYIADVNESLRLVAAHDRVVLIDAYVMLGDKSSVLAGEFADPDFFLHINAGGYRRLNAELEKILQARRDQP